MKMKGMLVKATLSAATLMVAATASAADDKLAQLRQQGFARIAIANEPPFTAVGSDGKVTGAGPDVARAAFKKMGVNDVVASISEYGAMIPGLAAGRHDAIAAGLFMTPQRCAAVAYSQPVLCAVEAFAVRKGNPKAIKSFVEIAKDPKVTLGVGGGTTEQKLAIAAQIPNDRIVIMPDGQSGLKMLQDGRIDALALPLLSIKDLISKSGDSNLDTIAPVPDTPIQCDGVAFRKQDTALRDAFDVELKKMKDSGEFAKIVEPYGFSAKAAMSTTREKLCTTQQ
ncbi:MULTISPECIES: ectoine/hydroxyectoine ABC transporter substrate-binding protein EhuB [Burkholderiaceae]|uniref:ectoine/hydroxyectoine ABC transporter substrate-binding protein EhuB n=1 Tax=Burkholderiaceae TaxID=119060 RepID=UPI001B9DC95C|nr:MULTISPECIES: ectoine/hydroxyectoine ABC transporter substrate-binding protein EhuB [Burkholderiaceae]MBR8087563.1 ectoine/hydroxyectoine ABC transporter substrate-binding protein EhuB [Burkholderia vietnamiensis]